MNLEESIKDVIQTKLEFNGGVIWKNLRLNMHNLQRL